MKGDRPMLLKTIITIIILIVIICRTSSVSRLIFYLMALYVTFKGLLLISVGTPVSFSTFKDITNTVAMIYSVSVMIIGIDSIFSEK